MIYIVYYVDSNNRKHITFVKSFKEVKSLKEKFTRITIKSYKVE